MKNTGHFAYRPSNYKFQMAMLNFFVWFILSTTIIIMVIVIPCIICKIFREAAKIINNKTIYSNNTLLKLIPVSMEIMILCIVLAEGKCRNVIFFCMLNVIENLLNATERNFYQFLNSYVPYA